MAEVTEVDEMEEGFEGTLLNMDFAGTPVPPMSTVPKLPWLTVFPVIADMALAMAAAAKKIKLENLLLNSPQAALLGAQHQALLGSIDPALLQHQLSAAARDLKPSFESFAPAQTPPAAPGTPTSQPGPTSQQGYFNCGQCQKVFWSEASLKHHASLYHSEKAFVCEICGWTLPMAWPMTVWKPWDMF